MTRSPDLLLSLLLVAPVAWLMLGRRLRCVARPWVGRDRYTDAEVERWFPAVSERMRSRHFH